ncbi:hypothetical protein M2119_000738 [Aurantimicrobium minutum]|uniref:bestrophin-like domain n=1 Tax=Aurantimicrobium minutum TaxID=708131 RepID=UPI0024742BE7|nr:hypothetical protein [Aurantimicrobium minutum]MDH6532501.1 hypothetical protein [Aurantimicrobium minutum]
MLAQILITQGILLACVLLGWYAGRFIHKIADKRFGEEDLAGRELGRLTDTLAFVGGAVGILLGLLLSFAVADFDDTKTSIQTMGRSSLTIFSAAESLEADQRQEIRRDVICILRSAVADDWDAIGNNERGGSPITTQWLLALNTDVSTASLDTVQQQQNFPGLLQGTIDLTTAREELVMGNSALIPFVVWLVIYFSSFIMSALLAMHLADRKVMARISAGMAWGILAVILFALTVLDAPLAPVMGTPSLEPAPIIETLDVLKESFPDEALWAECPPSPPGS